MSSQRSSGTQNLSKKKFLWITLISFILFQKWIEISNIRVELCSVKWRADFRGLEVLPPLTLTPISDFEESCFHRALNTIDPPTLACPCERIYVKAVTSYFKVSLWLSTGHIPSWWWRTCEWIQPCVGREGKGGGLKKVEEEKEEKLRKVQGESKTRERKRERSYERKVHWHRAASGTAHPSHHTHSCLTRSQSTIVMNWIWIISSLLLTL